MAFGIFMEFLVNIQSAINYMRMNKEEFCHAYFAKERYVQAYDMIVHPMLDESMWPAAMGDPLEPPPLRRLLGRSPPKQEEGQVKVKMKVAVLFRESCKPFHVLTATNLSITKKPSSCCFS